jgi:hypothetical protein
MYENEQATHAIAEHILQAFDSSSCRRLRWLFRLTSRVLVMDDSLRAIRTNDLFNSKSGLVELAFYYRESYPRFTTKCVEYIFDLLEGKTGRDTLAGQYLTALAQQGHLHWMTNSTS